MGWKRGSENLRIEVAKYRVRGDQALASAEIRLHEEGISAEQAQMLGGVLPSLGKAA